MLDHLYSHPRALARHRDAPLARARERFLVHCADQGYPLSSLRKIAWQLLVVVSTIDLRKRKIGVEEIERAATRPAVFCRRFSPDPGDSPKSTQQLFVHAATAWLGFLGRLQAPRAVHTEFSRQVSAFERYMREERGLSPATIRFRCDALGWFSAFLPQRRRMLDEISVADVDAFLATKGSAGWSRASLDLLAASLRSFFRYAYDQHWCAADIAAVIKGPRIFAQERPPRGLPWADVQRLLGSSMGSSAADIRDHAILMLLALYGLRAGEVSRLCLDDVDWVAELVSVTRPKQRCAQPYPWLPAVGEAVLRYLREARPRCIRRELFLTINAPHRSLSSHSVSALVRARLKAVGVTVPRTGAHRLRHACAMHLLASGFSFKEIGDHLGHRSADSTFTYAKVDLAGLRQVAEFDMGALL
jgi:site-specific recombinase XerD